MMQRKYGLILIAVGLLMFSVGSVISVELPKQVTVIVDDTPPEWQLTGDGLPAVVPRDGQSYSALNKIQASVTDMESEVVSVTGRLDGVTHTLTLWLGTVHSGTWVANIPMVTPGTHTISITATNEVGLSTTYSGTFEIYEELAGNWFINNILISDPNQIVKLDTLTLRFRFERTTGSKPATCTASWAGPNNGDITLLETTPDIWEGTTTVQTGGTYTVTLTATDGVGTVTMTIFNVDLPSGLEWPTLNWMQWLGIALMVAGGVVYVKGKGKAIET